MKLEKPLRLNMSYKDSNGNRISGAHSVANGQGNDLLNGELANNPISGRNPELRNGIPAGEDEENSNFNNGSNRPDTEDALKVYDEL